MYVLAAEYYSGCVSVCNDKFGSWSRASFSCIGESFASFTLSTTGQYMTALSSGQHVYVSSNYGSTCTTYSTEVQLSAMRAIHFHGNNSHTHSSSAKQLKHVACNPNEYVFELTDQTTGVKRLWMTYSMADCLECIAAVTSACISAASCNKDEYSMNTHSHLSQSNSSNEGSNRIAHALMSRTMEPSLLKKSAGSSQHLFSPSSSMYEVGSGFHGVQGTVIGPLQ
eukprot:gene26971-33624_t